MAGIDTDSGFVEQEDGRVMEEGCGEVESAFHTAAEGADAVTGTGLKPYESQGTFDSLAQRSAVDIVEGAEETEVLEGGEFVVKSEILGYEADPSFEGVGIGIESSAVNQHGAGVGSDESGDDGNGGGFAGTIGAEQCHARTGSDVKRNAVDDSLVAVAFDEVLDLEDRIWHGVEPA
jgi:hypothetical protein